MAGSRGQFFTVSEALQAILDKDSDCEDHAWDGEDDVDISPTTTLPLYPVPSTSAVAQEEPVLALRHLNVNMPQIVI